jgi:hypothetical protein
MAEHRIIEAPPNIIERLKYCRVITLSTVMHEPACIYLFCRPEVVCTSLDLSYDIAGILVYDAYSITAPNNSITNVDNKGYYVAYPVVTSTR